jgi:hypothetical protein
MGSQSPEVDTLERHFEEIIRVMDTRFTSHDFFLRLAHDHQCEYVAALATCCEGGNPFRDLHHELVARLRKREGKLITLRKANYPSRDIFGTPSHSGLWKKL